MAKIKPFKAIRPTRDKVALVSSESYETYTTEELEAKLNTNPYSFLHIINPGYKDHKEVYGKQRFKMVKKRFLEYLGDGVYIKDDTAAYYIYEKVTEETSYCGLICAASVKDYKDNIIKRHEATIKQREVLFQNYLKVTGFNAEPVLIMYPDNRRITSIINRYKTERPEYEFSTGDKSLHKMWLITKEEDIKAISTEFLELPATYIADGHHRSASSCLLADNLMAEGNHNGKENYNYFMSCLIPESQLQISEFYRLVKDLNGYAKDDFLRKIEIHFRLKNTKSTFYKPIKKHQFSMYLDGEFYALELKNIDRKFTNELSKLDAQILYETILSPILGILDERYDNRIAYLSGKKDEAKVKSEVDKGMYKVAFGMVPVSINEIKAIANANLTMPPKSTYVEPKLRSGLTIYDF